MEGAKLDMSNEGLFGYFRNENMVLCFVYYGFMSGFWGQSGYVIAGNYFSSLVVMNTLLLEPIIS